MSDCGKRPRGMSEELRRSHGCRVEGAWRVKAGKLEVDRYSGIYCEKFLLGSKELAVQKPTNTSKGG